MYFSYFFQSRAGKIIVTSTVLAFITIIILNPNQYSLPRDNQFVVSADFLSPTSDTSNRIHLTHLQTTLATSSDDDESSTDSYVKPLISYVVKAGDTLDMLARKFGVSIDQLKRLNNINDETLLRVNKPIYISNVSGVVYIVSDIPTSLMVFANMYDLNQQELMRVNGESDPMKPYEVGSAILVPNVSVDQAILLGILDKPKPIEVKKVIVSTAAIKKVSAAPQKKQTISAVTKNVSVVSKEITSAGGKIVKSWKSYSKISNGFVPGYCTYHVANRSDWLFKKLPNGRIFRPIGGNANQWDDNLRAKGFTLSKVPTVGAIGVVERGGAVNGPLGHVFVVLDVDRASKRILVEDMNYLGLYVVTQRRIEMNDTMTQATAGSNSISAFIPVQAYPSAVQKLYDDAVAKIK